MKRNILIAEDDTSLREGLVELMEGEGYTVETAADGRAALDAWRASRPSLLILDVMMPEWNGLEVCREIRRTDRALPILFLTAKSEEIDQVVGLKLGGDDYVTKPFSAKALVARVEALLRRSETSPSAQESDAREVFPFAEGEVDRRRYTFRRENEDIPLTARELRLLEVFFASPDSVLSRDQLLNEVWGINYYGTTRTLDQHIAQLRKKIEPTPHEPRYLTTVHGVGYRYQKPDPSA